MAETSTTKLGELTKKFKAVNKEVIAKLAEFGENRQIWLSLSLLRRICLQLRK